MQKMELSEKNENMMKGDQDGREERRAGEDMALPIAQVFS
jgi:hypothetical protein